MITRRQAAQLTAWSTGGEFVVNEKRSAKAEFERLAKEKGWTGGDEEWCKRWERLVGERYEPVEERDQQSVQKSCGTPKTRRKNVKKAKNQNKQSRKKEPEVSPQHLMADSDCSAFTLVSPASSVRSLGSADFAVIHGGASSSRRPPTHSVEHLTQDFSILSITLPNSSLNPSSQPSQSLPSASPYWLTYPSFIPRRNTPFKIEFDRLARSQHWTPRDKYLQRVPAIVSDLAFYRVQFPRMLDRWQDLCRQMGIEKVPGSANQCRKLLKSMYVDLYSILDHWRNPEVEVRFFTTRDALMKSVKGKGAFPRDAAKRDGVLCGLLQKL